jgi:hypothetical protein
VGCGMRNASLSFNSGAQDAAWWTESRLVERLSSAADNRVSADSGR